MAKCSHGYESEYCGKEYSHKPDWADDDFQAQLTKGLDDGFSKRMAEKAKSYLGQISGYRETPVNPLEEAGFKRCVNCSTQSVVGKYGLCMYCEELSDLNRSTAVKQAKAEEAQKAYSGGRSAIIVDSVVYWGLLGALMAVIGVLFAVGWNDAALGGGTPSLLAWACITPIYVKSMKHNLKCMRESGYVKPPRPTTGSTGPR